MSTCFGSSGLGASVCSYKTRGNGRHRGQAASIRTTLLGCGLTSRSTPTLAVTARPSRNCKCKATTAVAAVEQEPFKPATTAKPTADQIFDLHHVTQMSPSLLLYFPIGPSAMHLAKRARLVSSTPDTSFACRGASGKHTYGALDHIASCRCALAD